MPFHLRLTSIGNPDRGQDPARTLPGVRTVAITVASLTEASRRAREYITQHKLGGGNWPTTIVRNDDGKEVGQVAYNGVIWPPGGWAMGATPIHDPRPAAKEDPDAWEKATIEVPGHGQVVLSGCFRHATLNSAHGSLSVADKPVEFISSIGIGQDGTVKFSPFELHPDGNLSQRVATPKNLVLAIKEAVTDWIAEPENFAMVIRTEIKDSKREEARLDNMIERARKEVADLGAEKEKMADKVQDLEEMLSETLSNGPRL